MTEQTDNEDLDEEADQGPALFDERDGDDDGHDTVDALGSADDEVAGGVSDADPSDEAAPVPVLEMRQVAGLTSGSVMELHVGSFQFHESESDVGFAIVVDEGEEALIVPGTAPAHIDEVPLAEPTPLEHSVLNVGSACFTVRRHRPPSDTTSRLTDLEEIRRGPGAITVPDLTVADGAPTQNHSSRFGALFSRSDGETETLDHRWWAFLETVRESRSRVAERHRWLHPDPEELKSRLERLDPGLWDRTRGQSLFGRIAIAYATIPWEPRFDDPERIPTDLHGLIREMSQLPWVPVTANLALGPLGIVGARPAALAATRHAVLSLACLTAPSDLSFSIVTAKGLIDSWGWTSALPNSLFADGRPNAFPIAIADGMTHFDGAGLAHEAVLNNEMGLIAVAETVEELPDYCATILHIAPDGRCIVTNHMGEQVQGTPIGVTAGFAARLAATLTEAIGDEDVVPTESRPPAPPPVPPERRPQPIADTDTDTDTDTDDGEYAEIEAEFIEDPAIDADEPTSPDPGTDDDVAAPETTGRPPALAERPFRADDFADELSEMFGPSEEV